MTIDIDRNGSELLVTLEGKLDVLNSEELDKKLRQELLTAQRLVVDLIGVRYVSSTGVRVLMNAVQKMEEKGGVVLRNVTPEVMNVFRMIGIDEDLIIEE